MARKRKSSRRLQRGYQTTNKKSVVAVTGSLESRPVFKTETIKRTERILKHNDLVRLDRLKRPRLYLKRNYLGLPVAIKAANLTPLKRKQSELLYKFNPTPKRLIVCVRRFARRSTLFAKGHVGKGIKRRRKSFDKSSKVRC